MTATLPMSEQQLLDAVLELAGTLGYLCYHPRPARMGKAQTWVTAMQGDTGFPDLVLAGCGRTIFAELKRDGEKPRPSQDTWLAELHRGPAEAYCWKPQDWRSGEIEAVLRRA